MNKDHVSGLDGLRAIAILGVVFYHMIPNIVPGGYLGVTAFFTIMGYLMVFPRKRDEKSLDKAWTYQGAVGGTLSFAGEYYKKKILRLYPPLLCMMTASIAVLLFLVPTYAKSMLPEVASILFGYNNWWQIAQNASYFERMLNSSPFTHLWYLGLTVQYYLLYPFLLAVGYGFDKKRREKGKKHTKTILVVLCLLIAAASALEMALCYDPDVDPSRLYYGTDTRAFSLFLGLAIGLLPLTRISDGFAKVMIRIGTFALLGVIGVAYFTVTGESAANYHYQMQLVSLAFGVFLMALLLDQDGLGKWADILPLRFLGKYSYEVYLVMYPAIYFVQKKLPGVSNEIYVPVTIGVIAAAAAAVHALPALWHYLSKKHINNVWASRAAGAVLLSTCLALTGLQTAVSQSRGGTDDMAALEEELETNAALLAAQELTAKKTSLTAQLETVPAAINAQTESVVEAAKTRKDVGADAAAETLARRQEQNAQEMITVPASVSVTAIGDSVMLGASGALQSQIPGIYVNAAVSRQVTAGPGIISDLEAQGLLADIVVIHLGTNGASTLSKFQDVVDALGPGRKIFWINCVGPAWASDVNENVTAVCNNNPNVTLVEWTTQAAGNPNYFGSDGIHLTESGKRAYADMVAAALNGQ